MGGNGAPAWGFEEEKSALLFPVKRGKREANRGKKLDHVKPLRERKKENEGLAGSLKRASQLQ